MQIINALPEDAEIKILKMVDMIEDIDTHAAYGEVEISELLPPGVAYYGKWFNDEVSHTKSYCLI